jgi:transcription antitermination factor NusG
VYWNGKPAIIKEKEIQRIKQFLNEYENVEVISKNFMPHERVRIIAGPLMDQEGKVIEIKNNLAKVEIDSLDCILVASIDRNKLTTAPNQITS